jgi:hypothetical protein
MGGAGGSGSSASIDSTTTTGTVLGTYYTTSHAVFLGLYYAAPILISIDLASPGPYTYQLAALPNLTFTVKGIFASYNTSYTLDDSTTDLGLMANGSTYNAALTPTLTLGSHTIVVNAWNGTTNATSQTIAFQVTAETICNPSADPGTAPSPCALAVNVSSPVEWQTFYSGDNVTLAYEIRNSLSEALSYDACASAGYVNSTLFTNGDAVKVSYFQASGTGTMYVELNATRPGCTEASKRVYFYVVPNRFVAAPEIHPVVIAAVIAIALFVIYASTLEKRRSKRGRGQRRGQ